MRRVAAFFDVDRTLLPETSLERVFFRFLYVHHHLKWGEILSTAGQILHASVDWTGQRGRAYRPYLAGKPVAQMEALARKCVEEWVLPRIAPQALRTLEGHQRQGHWVVLLSGSLDLLVLPLAQAIGASDVIASRTQRREGRFTGTICPPVPYARGKELLLEQYARQHGIDLAASFAYGDSPSDRWMLSRVGHPRAVNPGWRLWWIARSRGWSVLHWDRASYS